MKVAVIGSGTMGSGVAQIAASNGAQTILYDINQEALDKSKAKLEKILNRLIEKERLDTAGKDAIQNNLSYVTDLNLLSDSDLVIEAIVENPSIKKKVFQDLEKIVSANCLIASNTSSLSITSLAASLKDPSRFMGIHFFNPAPLMKLVELIPALQTANEHFEKGKSIIDSWGKLTVTVKDTPGFIVNKVARPFYSEAIKIHEETGILPKELDHAIRTIGGFRMGPFELTDYIGHDVNYVVTETVWKAFYNDPRYTPSFTQKRLVEAGYLGRKSGRGFYHYNDDTKGDENLDTSYLAPFVARIVIMLINEAADTVFKGIATVDDIDTAMTKGVNYPKGLFAWADEIGIQECVDRMDSLYGEYHSDRYRCCPLLRGLARENKTFYPPTA